MGLSKDRIGLQITFMSGTQQRQGSKLLGFLLCGPEIESRLRPELCKTPGRDGVFVKLSPM